MKFLVHFTENRISQYRESLGLTQSQLADLVGVSKNTVSSWERGEFLPSLECYLLLNRVLCVPSVFSFGSLLEFSFEVVEF